MSIDAVPDIIQGGMGVAVSSWRLARAVAREGALGVVSGTALDPVLARRLQAGDPGGHLRRALAAFPVPEIAEHVLATWFRPGGKPDNAPFARTEMPSAELSRDAILLMVVGNFVEVFLAKEGHDAPIGINYLEKIQTPTLPSLLGAMLAGVDVVLMGAGIPVAIPGILDRLSRGEPVELRLAVTGESRDDATMQTLSPRDVLPDATFPLTRPAFLAIVSSHTVARTLLRRAAGTIEGFVIEGHAAGGHNAPPRRAGRGADDAPAFGPRDEPDLAAIAALGTPFWLAGSYGTPEGLVAARAAGARGVQVGSAFALCAESGMLPEIRREIMSRHADGTLEVHTDFDASPTGYPFKVAVLPGSTSDPDVRDARRRICDVGFLRELYARDDGTVGYRCPGEPVAAFVAKGGDPARCPGKQCICNGLIATIGLPQTRRGVTEPPTVTAGTDLSFLDRIPEAATGSYTAADVIRYLRR